MILGIMLKQKTGEWARVLVNIGDYREKEEDYLKNLAEGAAARAKETGEPQTLYNLKAGQRRIIHMFLTQDKEVETESQGEGSERYLLIKPKKG
jgi:spoIIIJ-associated protein